MPREIARTHIEAALATGIRGEARTLLNETLRVLAVGNARQSPTDLEYRNLTPGQKLTDPSRAGLIMRCGTRSGRQWFFRHQHPTTGKQVELKLGAYPQDLSVANARDLWDEMRQARNAGLDPQFVMTGSPTAQATMTVGELADRYIAEYAKPTKRSWKQDYDLLQRHLVPSYGNLPATKFTHKEAGATVERYSQVRPCTAGRARPFRHFHHVSCCSWQNSQDFHAGRDLASAHDRQSRCQCDAAQASSAEPQAHGQRTGSIHGRIGHHDNGQHSAPTGSVHVPYQRSYPHRMGGARP